MPTITLSNGQRVKVGDGFLKLSPEERDAAVDEIAADLLPKAEKSNAVEDVVYSGAQGVREGVTGLAGTIGDVQTLARGALKKYAGLDETQIPQTGFTGMMLGAHGYQMPTSEDTEKFYTETLGGPSYEPQTKAGEYSRTAGSFAPALIGGSASLPTKLATRVLGPAVATQAAGDIAKEYDPELERPVRAGTALLSGAVGGLAEGAVAARGRVPMHDAPTDLALKKASSNGYKNFREVPIAIKPAPVQSLSTQIKRALVDDGFLPSDAPATYSKLNLLKTKKSWTPTNYHSVRKSFGRSAFNKSLTHPEDAAASTLAMKMLDDFFENGVQPQHLSKGTQADLDFAKRAFSDANANYGAYKRSQAISGPQHEADLRAGASYSGFNRGNALRQKMASTALTSGGKKIRGFDKNEVKELENIVKGTKKTNVTRYVSNLMAGGGGVGAGAFFGAPLLTAAASGNMRAALGSAVPVAGSIMRKYSNNLTEGAVNELGKSLRRRSPLAETLPFVKQQTPEDDLWLRALLLATIEAQAKEREAGK